MGDGAFSSLLSYAVCLVMCEKTKMRRCYACLHTQVDTLFWQLFRSNGGMRIALDGETCLGVYEGFGAY